MNKLSQNIVLSFSTNIVKEDKTVHYFLTYLKLRSICKDFGGNIPSVECCAERLQLSVSTTKRHLCLLKRLGWIRKTKYNLQIVSMYKISANVETHKEITLFEIPDELLFQFNWTNIASFKALLVEMRLEQYSNYQNLCHKKAEQKILKEKTGNYIKAKKSDVSSYKKRVRKKFHKYFALSLTAQIVDKSVSTTASYRMKIADMYLYKTFKPKRLKASFQRKVMSISGYDITEVFNDSSRIYREKEGVNCKSQFGHYYFNKGRIMFQECSRRKETNFLKKVKNNCKKFPL